MTRATRRTFLKTLGSGAATLAGLSTTRAAEQVTSRGRAPFKTLYSNDTTNILSCISPYHRRGEPFTDDRLRASIDEAQGVDVHMLQPGLGWIPWWRSDVYNGAEHYLAYQREFGLKPDSFGRYMTEGGDVVKTFVEHCRKIRVAPFISYRLNDGHHVRELKTALAQGRPSRAMSRFYWQNYQKYRLGPDPSDWSQAVFNWAIPEVREHKFALIGEICRRYDIDGLELDFLRHYAYFRPAETTSPQRRRIMTEFVRRVREVLDATAPRGQRRWLCVRVPTLIETHDVLGIDLAALVAAGVDMVNLSASYFTTQATDLPRVHALLPETPLYLEMTHTPMTGKALAGSGSQVFQRTTDHQFYTTAHLAYCQGAAGVSLFNFVYYRDHVLPELGPFNEPPFHVLPKLNDRAWLARQPQWYFLAGIPSRPPTAKRALPVQLAAGGHRKFSLRMAPTEHQTRDGLLRLMSDEAIVPRRWQVEFNGIRLAATDFVRKPIDHPYEGHLGEPEHYACYICPRSAVRAGANEVHVMLDGSGPGKLIYLDVVLT
jgi:hypothetical protein